MIIVHGFGKAIGVEDPSPFVLKVQSYLKMAAIEYELKSGIESYKKSPRALLPFIEDGEKIIADSYFIIEYLKKNYVDLDHHLSDRQKASLCFMQQALDTTLYEIFLSTRWQGENWPKIKEVFFKRLPIPSFMQSLIASKSQKKVLQRLNYRINKYSYDELLHIADDIFRSLSTTLGGDHYMYNNQVSTADALCFAYLAQFILCDIKSPFSEKAEYYENLVAYCHHIQNQFFT